MVGFDFRRDAQAAFNAVGIDGSLSEVFAMGDVLLDIVEDVDECLSDDLAFLFRLGHAF